jgi:peroxiredoxin
MGVLEVRRTAPMDNREIPVPARVGQPAPDFNLPVVGREGSVSLADYRERATLLLVLNRGFWCTFCRRYIAQLGGARQQLRALGVEVLVVVATDHERVEFYVKRRPVSVPLAADPDLATHRAYGMSVPPMLPEYEELWAAMRLRLDQTAFNPVELSQLADAVPSAHGDPVSEVPINDLRATQARLYPHELSESETRDRTRYGTMSTGQFLVDRQGVVQWNAVQWVTQPPATLGNFPTQEELLTAARRLAH